ncbi:MAG: alkaline phosphatase D family protein [Steroidobacter sp.]
MAQRTAKYSRRAAMVQLGGALAAATLPTRLLYAADALRFRADPFTLGVASGYPAPDTVVLWTRIAPAPFEPGGGIPNDAVIPVTWEVASDERMQKILRSGVDYSTAQWAHSIHAEPAGLEPGRDYWYRFTAGGKQSPIGRTRTAPRFDDANAHLRIAVASCQQYEHGYFNAYRHMLDDELDVIMHVGDYIYEASWGQNRIRSHNAPEVFTLDDYRARYALYRGERELQAAHAACPWLVTWDDHEVENDYAGAVSEEDDAREWFLARRAAAYQAYYEHMPLPRRAIPFGAEMGLFSQRSFGQLANVFMMDTRQYRAPLACTDPGRRTSRSVSCAELSDPARSKLGAAQEGWLASRMAASRARWNLFASGTVMAYVDERPGPGEVFWNDGWNGYPAARARLMETIAQSKVANPIILSGDIHSFLAAHHHRIPNDRDSPMVATEFVATSISAQGLAQRSLDERRANNPNLLFANSERRGYLRLDVTRERLQADMIAVESVTNRDAGRFVQASFVVEDGRPAEHGSE